MSSSTCEPLEAAQDGTGDGAADFVFRSAVTGGRVPREYVRAVEAGCRDALAEGPLGGHPVTGLRVTLTDGATHPKDSSEMAFRTAGRFALREALAGERRWRSWNRSSRSRPPCPRTPWAGCSATWRRDAARSPASAMRAGTAVVTATVPLAELFGYASRLRSRTQGRGTFTTRATGYAPVPGAVSDQVVSR